MGVQALSSPSVELTVGAVWTVSVSVRDANGCLTADAPVVTVTLPNASTVTPTVETVTVGIYRAEYQPAAAGRFVASAVTSTHGRVDFVAVVQAVTANASMPSVDTFKDYAKIPDDDTSLDDEITAALDAEAAAQRKVCRVPAAYPADLQEALHRRVARNLAMRGIPLAVLRGDSESGDTVLPGHDPEIRRLERGHRRMVMR